MSVVYPPFGLAAALWHVDCFEAIVAALWQKLPRSLVFAALAILTLNFFDMLLTMRHLSLGAVELNPLMRGLLEHSPFAFAAGKHFLVGAGVLALTTQCHHTTAAAALRFVALPAYVFLALYQVVLLGLAAAP
jgi:hypothetical protein